MYKCISIPTIMVNMYFRIVVNADFQYFFCSDKINRKFNFTLSLINNNFVIIKHGKRRRLNTNLFLIINIAGSGSSSNLSCLHFNVWFGGH